MIEFFARLYDKVEIISDVEAVVTSPDKTVFTLKPFARCKLDFSYDKHGYESVTSCNEYSVVRFFPSQKGEYVLRFLRRPPVRVLVSESKNHGVVRVCAKDKRYFEYEDGTPFFVVGLNTAFITPVAVTSGSEFGVSREKKYLGLRQFGRWFGKASENGVNVVRLWLGHDYLCPDTEIAGEADVEKFEKIEAVVDLAKSYGLKVKLTIEQFRFFDYEHEPDNSYSGDVFGKFNKRMYLDNKRCESISEWLTGEQWRKTWLKKVEIIARRFSGDPSVFMIELWNEMNCTSPEYVEWNEKILPAVKNLFPHNLVSTSPGSYDCERTKNEYAAFPWDKCDVVQIHRYLDQGAEAEECRSSLIDLLKNAIEEVARRDKPFIVAETGAVNDCHSGAFRYYPADDEGVIFCDAVYVPPMCGAAGTGFIWHWDERYVESKNLYRLFRPIATVFENVDFAEEKFEPRYIETEEAILLLLYGKNVTLAYVRNKNYSWQTVLRDGEIPKPISVDFDVRAASPDLVRIVNGETATVSGGERLKIKDLVFGALLKW